MDKLLQSLTKKKMREKNYTAFPLSYKTYCNGSSLKNFLTLPHTLLSTCNSLLSFIELPTRAMNSHAIPTTLSSQFHSSPPESGFLPSTPWQPLCDDPWLPMWPNTPIISLLIQHPSNAQQVNHSLLKSFLHLASRMPKTSDFPSYWQLLINFSLVDPPPLPNL